MPGKPGAGFFSVKRARAEQGASCFPVSGRCPKHNCSELKWGTLAVKWLNTAPVRVRGEGELLLRALGTTTATMYSPAPGYSFCEKFSLEQSSTCPKGAGGMISRPQQANVTTVLNCSKCYRLKISQTLWISRVSQQHIQQQEGLTFQERKLTGSTTVGWMISLPGKMPQVTALGCRSGALVIFWPCKENKAFEAAAGGGIEWVSKYIYPVLVKRSDGCFGSQLTCFTSPCPSCCTLFLGMSVSLLFASLLRWWKYPVTAAYLDIDNVVVDPRLVFLQNFEQCRDNLIGGEEL